MNTLPVVSGAPVSDAFKAPSDLSLLFKFLRQYRTGIALVTIASTLVGLLIALSLPPLYRATVTLLIEPRTPRVVQVQDVYDPTAGSSSSEYFATQFELLRSRGLASQVVEKLKLHEDAEFLADNASESLTDSLSRKLDWQHWLPGLPEPAPEPLRSEEQRRERAVSILLSQIVVQPVPRTRLVRLNFFSSKPQIAQRVATAIADTYIESGLESRLEETQRAGRWLTGKLGDLSTELQNAERALQVYRDENQIVAVGGNRGLIDQELIENSQRLRDAQRIKTDLSSTYTRIRAAGNDPARLEQITTLLQDAGVQKARAALLDAEQNLKQVQQRYGDKHPQMAVSMNSLEAVRRAFNEQLQKAAEGVRNQYEIAADTERQQSQVVSSTTNRARALDRKQFELGVLEREVQTNRQLYDLFLQRFKETDSTASFEPFNARITDGAQLPKVPVLPDRLKIILTAALVGLLLGIALASLRSVLSEGLHTVEDLENLAQVPLFGIVPRVPFKRDDKIVKYFLGDPRTPFAEGLRSVRTAMQLAELDGRRQCYVITSAAPGEGKSSVATCLALALSSTEKVLLLEADLRAPSIRKMLGIPKQHNAGLMEVLLGTATLDAAIHTDASGLHVLAVFQRPPNPAETVSSMAFAALFKELRSRYDRIIIDSPPCLAASDTLVLARLADAVLFLARAEETKKSSVRRAIHQLRATNAPLVGCVLNRVDVRRNAEAYGDYRYASRYYG